MGNAWGSSDIGRFRRFLFLYFFNSLHSSEITERLAYDPSQKKGAELKGISDKSLGVL